MNKEPDTTESITTTLERSGYPLGNITEIRSRVFRGTLASETLGKSANVYIKVYDPDKKPQLEEFTAHATDVGYPPARLVDGEQLCLMMGVADGRPLSRILPIVTVPGIWYSYGDDITYAYKEIGRQIGTLHDRTQSGSGPLLPEADAEAALEQMGNHREKFDSELVATMRTLFEEATETQTAHAITYGDRSPHNIYWNGERVTQIDATCKRRSVVADHSSTLMGIRLMIGRLPYARGHIQDTLEEAYWGGYARTGQEESMTSELVAVRYLKRSLDLLSYYDSAPRSLNTRLTRRIDPPVVCREIARTVEEVSGS